MQHEYTPAEIEHFHRCYLKAEVPGGCWEWAHSLSDRHGRGYGFFTIRRSGRLVRVLAHRAAYAIHHGAIPDGLWVRHACDNRTCVRPDHLLIGTAADNSRDMVERERQTRGVEVNTARLTEDDVREIRRLSRAGWTQHPLAKRFGIARSTIQQIVTGKTWKHVA